MTRFVAQRIPRTHRWIGLHAARQMAGRLRARCNLAPQQRAALYVSTMPPAVITATPGGHRSRAESDRK
ncbi:hypothetical protein BST37_21930 [Mycobacterium noviomagense]|uniref:Uncharacterized protein n=1 Tax=Mycobacterium noviomagense TaxID=459858 RepID=A0ABX3T1F6_9MYCO|nr:hypothetical protein BST37_21930 [Mycobacterium noviomagense]